MSDKLNARKRRARSTRAKISVQMDAKPNDRRHRLTVYRSLQHICAQVIDQSGVVLAQASTRESSVKEEAGKYGGNVKSAAVVGKILAERAKKAGVERVAFDRSGFKYHGRIKALADAARSVGIEF